MQKVIYFNFRSFSLLVIQPRLPDERFTMIPHAPLRLFAALTLAGTSWLAQAADLTVAYQTTVDPAKVAQVDGDYEKASKASIDWRKFDNGADVITAVASGDVQIGYLGSSPLAAAATRKLPVETFLIATQIGAGEALVARDSIKTPQDLIGKKVAVPFVSTGHYSLLAALKTGTSTRPRYRSSTSRRRPSLPPGNAATSTPPTCGTRPGRGQGKRQGADHLRRTGPERRADLRCLDRAQGLRREAP
jgi:hypothetical protein